jgi:hypothetical protein
MSVLPALALVTCFANVGQESVTVTMKPLTLPIAVYDYADLPSQWLSWAEEEMTRIYRGIGIEITWLDVRPPAKPADGLIVLIRPGLTKAERAIPEGVMGFSSGTADERRRVAYVLYGRMEQFRLEQVPPIERAKLLGHIMAHEVGHLLLPGQSHSPTGLMRGQWSRAELERAQHGRLRFTDEQAQLIRTKVSRFAVHTPRD